MLHELVGVPFPQIARVVGRSPAAVRQLAARARAHVAAGPLRLDVDAADHRRTVEAFGRGLPVDMVMSPAKLPRDRA